jgi:hypothetical protein
MPRRVPAVLLVLAIVGGCAAVDANEPRDATIAPAAVTAATPAPPAVTPSALPAARASAGPSVPGSPSPSPGPATTPMPARSSAPPLTPKAASGPFEISLATRADYVPQYTFEWCVGASLQMARTMVSGYRNESRRSQERLWEMARDRSPSPYGGANPIGWTAALNDLGLGPYELVSLPTFSEAVTTAARALAETRRPVGLVMWAGRHAWVMTGFEATADPRRDADARVTRVRVMDPLYPHGSRWGPSPAPNTLVSLRTLGRQFVARQYRPSYPLGVEPGWLLVLPVS